ncbi:hypothetical protein [Streptomyces pakalii]|uniref:Uncharacterized protein n=1 Tax=Streptomyces pakalii TaxID=3036494 RepID=A0ABT7D7N0_9ACTN|nr:hypothetical protein [Streptomyces pakalii]MDJ1641814.1 hypothetical protein [Streptomyces pakalii]
MARFTGGRTYGASGENTYYGCEHRIGALAGQTFLALFVACNTTENRLRFAWKCMTVTGADSRKV